MTRIFNAVIIKEGAWYVAQCLDVDVASQGETEEEAIENLNDALMLHFAPPVATLLPIVRHIELDIAACGNFSKLAFVRSAKPEVTSSSRSPLKTA